MKAIHEKQINEKFAQANNLSIDEMNAQAQEVFATLPEVDPKTGEEIDEDARWARAYRRVRGASRKKARSMADSKDGMIVCRMTNLDFDRKQYDYAMRILNKDGLDAALSQGLVNKDGHPIHRWGNKSGEPILNEDKKPGRPQVSGRAIGYTFEKDADGEYKNIDSRYIIIPKKRADDMIPVCQLGKIALSINDDKQQGFFNNNNSAYYNDAAISNNYKVPYDYDEVQEILGQWNEAFKDNFSVISNIQDLMTFQKEHTYTKDNKKAEYDFCVIPGIVAAISPSEGKYSNDTIILEFIDYDTLETSTLYIFINKEMLQGLAMQEDDQGICVLQSSGYVNKDGEMKYQWHLGGFLPVDDSVDVEDFFGVSMDDEDAEE